MLSKHMKDEHPGQTAIMKVNNKMNTIEVKKILGRKRQAKNFENYKHDEANERMTFDTGFSSGS